MITFKYLILPTDESNHDGFVDALSTILVNKELCVRYREQLNAALSTGSIYDADVLGLAIDLATAEMIVSNTKHEYEQILNHPEYNNILLHAKIKAAGKL